MDIFEDYQGIEAFSVKQISYILQLPLSTTSLYCKEGKIPCFKVGRHYRVLKKDLFHFISEQKADKLL